MISQIMDYCKNHFARSYEYGTFNIVADGIEGTFSEKYVAGQYVWIKDSFINDGVYKILTVESNKLTLDTELLPESTQENILLFGCSPVKGFLDLVTDIQAYVQNGAKDGIASERIDDYSVAYSGNGSWTNAFSSRLAQYRRMFDDYEKLLKGYNIRTKRYY